MYERFSIFEATVSISLQIVDVVIDQLLAEELTKYHVNDFDKELVSDIIASPSKKPFYRTLKKSNRRF